MASIGQIVRQIIEQLSDGVSQLVLMVVVLQEQNADVPPNLPTASNAVLTTAVTLGKVATQLAASNYKNFPEIAKEIVDAANAVNGATETFTKAMNILQSNSDRKTGWNGLVDACRIMSGKTIKLLQIVYGAELKRLFTVADDLMANLGNLDTSLAQDNPQAFADRASELASKAAQLAAYIHARAKDEESPLLKAELIKRAQALDDKANSLINAVNDLLQDPTNAAAKKAVADAVKELEDLIAATSKTIRENQTELPDANEEDMPTLSKAITKKAADDLDVVMREAVRHAAAPAPVAPATAAIKFTTVSEPERVSAVESQVAAMRKAAENLNSAAQDQDAKAAAASAEELLKTLGELKKGVNEFTATSKDAARNKQIAESLAQLESLVAKQMSAVKKAVETGDAEAKKAARDATIALRMALEDIRKETTPTLADKMDRMKTLLAEIQDATKKGDHARVAALRTELAKLAKDLEHEGKWVAQSHTDPVTAKKLVDAINSLLDATKLVDAAAASSDKAKLDASAKNALHAIEELQALTNAIPMATLMNCQTDLDKLEAAAAMGDAPGLAVAAGGLSRNMKALLKQAQEAISKIADPEQRARAQANLNEIQRKLAEQLAAIKHLQNHPNDPAAKANLQSKSAALRDALRGLEDALSGRAGAGVDGVADPAAAQAALSGLASTMLKLDELTKRLQANPKDKDAQAALKNALGDLDRLNAALLEAISKDPEVAIVAKAEEVKTISDALSAAIAKNDPKAVVEESKRLAAASKQLIDQLRALSQKAAAAGDTARAAELENAAKNVEAALSHALLAAKEAINHSNDPARQLDAQRAIAILKHSADRAGELTGASIHDEKDMRDAAALIEQDFAKAKEAAMKGDVVALEQAIQKLEKDRAKFARSAQRREAQLKDEAARKKAQEALAEFQKLAEKLGHAARELARNPKDAKAEKEVDTVTQEAQAKLHQVLNAHKVDTVAAVQDVEASLDKIMDALDRSDPTAAATEAKVLVAKTNALVPMVQAETDPAKQAILFEAVKELNEKHIRTVLTDASEAIKDPENLTKRDKVREDIAKAKVPLAKMVGALSPDRDRQGLAAVKQAQADIESLQAAIRSGDPAKIKAAKEHLQQTLKSAIDTLKAAIAAETDPAKKKMLEDKLKRLEKLMSDLSNPNLTVEQLGRLNLQIADQLAGLTKSIGADKLEEVARAAGRVAPLSAKLRDTTGDNMTLEDFMNLATQLGTDLASLMGLAGDMARAQRNAGNLSSDAAAALALDDLLRQMEGGAVPVGATSTADLSALLDQLNKLGLAPAEPALPPAGEEKTFDAVLERAAETIQIAVQEAQMDNAVSEGIVSELRKLASAARSGQRQAMLIASRAIAANVTSLVTEIQGVLTRMGPKNPKEQDRLIRNSQALRNFATQLKILTSVKAASIDKDNDQDESLFSVTRGLGKVVAEAIGSLDTVKITVLKENPNKKH